MKRNCEVVQSIPGWTDTENPYRLSRPSYIFNLYIYNMSSSCYNILTISPSVPVWSEFTGWAIIEELSIRRRLRTFDQLWTENECERQLCWFIVVIWALVSDNMYLYGRHFRFFNPTILETVSPGGFDCLGQHGESFFYWNTTTSNNSSTDVSLLM